MATLLINLVQLIVTLITILFFVNMLISFAPIEPWHPVRRFMQQLTDPILRPFRNLIPPVGMLDLTPMLAIIVVQIVGWLLVQLIAMAFG